MYKRNILATFHTRNADKTLVLNPDIRPRRYVRVQTAIPRAVEILLWNGSPGDVVELSHAELVFAIATITVHVGGKVTIQLEDLS